jgi:hypothetical protein
MNGGSMYSLKEFIADVVYVCTKGSTDFSINSLYVIDGKSKQLISTSGWLEEDEVALLYKQKATFEKSEKWAWVNNSFININAFIVKFSKQTGAKIFVVPD